MGIESMTIQSFTTIGLYNCGDILRTIMLLPRLQAHGGKESTYYHTLRNYGPLTVVKSLF